MERYTGYLIKLCFTVLLGAALLILSAVVENGETAMSRALVKNMNEVPQMIEALLAGAVVTTAGGAASCALEKYFT